MQKPPIPRIDPAILPLKDDGGNAGVTLLSPVTPGRSEVSHLQPHITAPNSVVAITNVFLGSNNSVYSQGGSKTPGANVTIKNKAVAALADAKPRPAK